MNTEQKTRRELALERALVAVLKSASPMKEIVADMLIGQIAAESDRRAGRPEVVRQVFDGKEYVRDANVIRRVITVELMKIGLPPEVLAALA